MAVFHQVLHNRVLTMYTLCLELLNLAMELGQVFYMGHPRTRAFFIQKVPEARLPPALFETFQDFAQGIYFIPHWEMA